MVASDEMAGESRYSVNAVSVGPGTLSSARSSGKAMLFLVVFGLFSLETG